MTHDLGTDARHLIGSPCKDLLILQQEFEQLGLLGLRKLAPQQKKSVRVVRVDPDLCEVFDALLRWGLADIPKLSFSVQLGHVNL